MAEFKAPVNICVWQCEKMNEMSKNLIFQKDEKKWAKSSQMISDLLFFSFGYLSIFATNDLKRKS